MRTRKPVIHPSTKRLLTNVSERFLNLRKQHDVAVNRMWVGTLASNFTDDELALLANYLCPNDHKLLKRLGR